MKKVTTKQVAELCGVSQSTISRVFNPNPKYVISERIRKKVLKIAKQTGYVPNRAATTLNTGICKNVGIILESIESDLSDPWTARMLSGFIRYMDKNDYSVTFVPIIRKGKSSEKNSDVDNLLIDIAKSTRVDGFFSTATMISAETVKSLEKNKIPLVIQDYGNSPEYVCSVVGEDTSSAFSKLSKLIASKNYRNIKYLMFDGHNRLVTRLEQFKKIASMDGINITPENLIMFKECSWSALTHFPYALEQALGMIDQLKDADLLICSSDLLALGVVEALKIHNIFAGKDYDICGYDNLEVPGMLDTHPPFLTTIDSHHELYGSFAAKMLLEELREPELRKRRVLVDAELIIRDSLK